MPDALIGSTGFVGTTLLRQTHFDALYRSTNITAIDGLSFDRVVCAGAPAQKWLANADPKGDQAKIDGLIARLETIRCKTCVLISTVDVFPNPIGVDEFTPVDEEIQLSAYGSNRRRLERFVERRFPESLIVRLPGLVGPGLRKNVVFDLLNDNNLAALDSRAVFQFYPTVNLWSDILTALDAELRLVHLTAEPISIADVAALGFGRDFEQARATPPVRYDLRTRYASHFGAGGPYQYDRRSSIQAVRTYAQTEPRTHHAGARASL